MPDFTLAAALALASAVGATQEPTVVRTTTRLVQINVIVRDKDGPVTNLNKSDFVLTDRGKTQAISVFSIHLPAAKPEESRRLPANTFSNRVAGASGDPAGVTMILLDRLNTFVGSSMTATEETSLWNGDLALSSAKQHLLKLVEELNPQDRIAIYSLGESLTVLSDFTSDRDQLRAVLKNYSATSITSREVAEPNEVHVCPPNQPDCSINARISEDRQMLAGMANATRAQTTMTALLAMAAHAAGIPGRKNLVWLTANLPLSGDALGRAFSRANVAIYPVDVRGLLPRATGHNQWDDFKSEMSRSPGGTAVLSGSAGDTPRPPGIDQMQTVADATGGRAFFNTNDLTGAIHQVLDDGAATYTLGFYVEQGSLDGKFHELKLRVKRAGLDVRTQKGYFASKDAAAENGPASLAIPMTSPLEGSAIHLLARVERAGTALSISGSIDLRDLRLDRSGDSTKGAVEVYIVQQDAAGATIERRRQPMNLHLTRAEYDAYLKSGIFFRTLVEQKEKLKTLRVVVIDRANGTAGSLIIPVSEIR